MHACMLVCTCMHECVLMYTRTHVFMYAHMHVCKFILFENSVINLNCFFFKKTQM
jgi:hypothetical protein